MSFNDALNFIYLFIIRSSARTPALNWGQCAAELSTGSARLQVSISSDDLCSQAGIQWNAKICSDHHGHSAGYMSVSVVHKCRGERQTAGFFGADDITDSSIQSTLPKKFWLFSVGPTFLGEIFEFSSPPHLFDPISLDYGASAPATDIEPNLCSI
jgi:hypothetical protein